MAKIKYNTLAIEYAAEQLKVRPINREELYKHLATLMDIPENISYDTRAYAIVEDCNILTDTECVYNILENSIFDRKMQLAVEIPFHKITISPEGRSHGMFPEFHLQFGIEQIEKFLEEPVSLKEFMDSRFNYNPRIQKNTYNMLVEINENKD